MREYFTQNERGIESTYTRRDIVKGRDLWRKESEGAFTRLQEAAYISPDIFNFLMDDLQNGKLTEDEFMTVARENDGFEDVGGRIIYRCRNSEGELEVFCSSEVTKVH